MPTNQTTRFTDGAQRDYERRVKEQTDAMLVRWQAVALQNGISLPFQWQREKARAQRRIIEQEQERRRAV